MKIAVIGSGTMGSGIAQTFAQANEISSVYLVDISIGLSTKGKDRIEANLNRLVEKGGLNIDRKIEIINKILPSSELEDSNIDFLIEAVSENNEIKKSLFMKYDVFCNKKTVFATNTSSLSVTELGRGLSRPLVGMHFFNPAPVMKLVEITKGFNTSDEAINKILELSSIIDKTSVEVMESPGFVVNRLLIPMINEAVFIYSERIASKEDIDISMKLGANHPMGPLELGDLIGLDVVLAIMNVLEEEFGDSKYRAAPLLKKMVRANKLGRKTKEGFYLYK